MSATHPVHLRRPVPTGATWRAALAVVAAVAVAIEAPAWIRLPLSLAAVVGTATFFHRRYGQRGLLDTVLLVVGGGIVALILLGMLLNLTPAGITVPAWGIAIGVLELGALAFLALFRAPVPAAAAPLRRVRPAAVAWTAAVLIVTGGAYGLSAMSFTATHVAPLAMSVLPAGASTEISVTAGRSAGPYSLVLVTGGTRSEIATDVRVGPDDVFRSTIVTPSTRSTLELVPSNAAGPVRTLELDPAATGSATR